MEIRQKADKKEFYKCNLYYLRKYFGLKELIMSVLLLVAGLVLYFSFGNYLILVLFFIFCAVAAIAFVFYGYTVFKGWQLEYEKPGVSHIVLRFGEDSVYFCDLIDEAGKKVSADQFDLKNTDKVAFLKGKTYLYQGAASMFYIFPDSFTKGEYEEFRKKLSLTLEGDKFRMKTKRKVFPKPVIK
ncbi:MAG: hypothetical protein ACOYIQ_00960 [Christensenellales bacterium]